MSDVSGHAELLAEHMRLESRAQVQPVGSGFGQPERAHGTGSEHAHETTPGELIIHALSIRTASTNHVFGLCKS